jgi:signal recognition particle subunit SRP54
VPSLRESLYLRTFSAHAVLSVAATQTPIIFLGVGEHLTDLDKFSPQPFISKLLGLGDVQGLMEHMQDMAQANPDKQKEMAKKLEEGKLSLRDYREQIQNVMSMQVCVSPWHERSI